MEGELWKSLDGNMIRNVMWAIFFSVALYGCLKNIGELIKGAFKGHPGVYNIGDKVYFASEGYVMHSTITHIIFKSYLPGEKYYEPYYRLEGMVGEFEYKDLYDTFRGARKQARKYVPSMVERKG